MNVLLALAALLLPLLVTSQIAPSGAPQQPLLLRPNPSPFAPPRHLVLPMGRVKKASLGSAVATRMLGGVPLGIPANVPLGMPAGVPLGIAARVPLGVPVQQGVPVGVPQQGGPQSAPLRPRVTYEPLTPDDLSRFLRASKGSAHNKGLTQEQFEQLVDTAEQQRDAPPSAGSDRNPSRPVRGNPPGRRFFIPEVKNTVHLYKPQVYHANVPDDVPPEHAIEHAHEHVYESPTYTSIHDEDSHSRTVVLEALWRAVKSVTGGAMAVGGAFARNSGRILEAKGRLMQTTGPIISEMGRIVADEALHNHHAHYELSPSEVGAEAVKALEAHARLRQLAAAHDSIVPPDSFSKTAWDLADTLRLSAKGATKAIFQLVSELSGVARRAYLLKSR